MYPQVYVSHYEITNALLCFKTFKLLNIKGSILSFRVRDACAEFLQMRLTPQNVLGIRHFAESLGKFVIQILSLPNHFLNAYFSFNIHNKTYTYTITPRNVLIFVNFTYCCIGIFYYYYFIF